MDKLLINWYGGRAKSKKSSNRFGGGRDGSHRSKDTLGTVHCVWLSVLVLLTILPLVFRLVGGVRMAQIIGEQNLIFGNRFLHGTALPSIEIFAAPKPFVGPDRDVNIRALQSWLRLEPQPKVTLLGWEVGYDDVEDMGVSVDPGIDRNFLGVPLFNSLLERANRSRADVAVLINGDIILGQDFITILQRVRQQFKNYLIIAARYDVSDLPEGESEEALSPGRLRRHIDETGQLHTYGGMDLWAWNTGGPRLVKHVVPHFVFGRGKYDNWLVHEAIENDQYAVVDVSESVMLVHVSHDYRLVSGSNTDQVSASPSSNTSTQYFWSVQKKSKFELFANIYSALSVGSYRNQRGTLLHAPYKMTRCEENAGSCLLRRVRPASCLCEFSPFTRLTQTDPSETSDLGDNGVIKCGKLSVEELKDYTVPITPSETEENVFGLPLTLESLLARVAANQTVVVTAVSYGHHKLLFNWVCNMRRIGVTNFIIAALDEVTYEYGFLRGFPIYYDHKTVHNVDVPLAPAAPNSPELHQLQILGFSVVQRVVSLGYNVIWSDVDVLWFRDPTSELAELDGDLLILADQKYTVNPAFYQIRRNKQALTIVVLQNLVALLRSRNLHPGIALGAGLCGEKGERRLLNNTVFVSTETKATDKAFPKGSLAIFHDGRPLSVEQKIHEFQRRNLRMVDYGLELCVWFNNDR